MNNNSNSFNKINNNKNITTSNLSNINQIGVKKSIINPEIHREFGKDLKKNNNLTNDISNQNVVKQNIKNNFINNENINTLNYFKKDSIIINNEIIQNHVKPNNEKMDLENQNFVKEQQDIEIYIDDNEQKMDIENNNNEEISINKNPQNVQEYFSDIFNYYFEIESNYLPISNYMDNQNDINEKMRGILNDWLIEVHLKYKLVPDTMYLTINLIDRFLSKKKILRTKLQLVGVTAMFIASKYEEIFPPEAKDFVYITDNACNKKELLNMEVDMLSTLNFDITIPSQYRFLELYKQILNLSDIMFNYSYYLLDLCLINYKMIKYKFSELAATAALISIKIFKGVLDNFEKTGYKEKELTACCKDMCNVLQNSEKSNLPAVRKKFSLAKYMEVAKTKIL
jgi:cyclin B